jgi:ribonuclease HI
MIYTLRQTHQTANMKKINIYSRGSCDASSRIGKYFSQLEYENTLKNLTGELFDTTANRCIIQGCIEAVTLIKEPCDVEIFTSTKIGVEKFAKGKGVNKDLIAELIGLLKAKKCQFKFTTLANQSDWLNKKIACTLTT